jgi:tetratricopeptide (TPR) repeat protein
MGVGQMERESRSVVLLCLFVLIPFCSVAIARSPDVKPGGGGAPAASTLPDTDAVRIRDLITKRLYAQGESLATVALRDCERMHGLESPEVASALDLLVECRWRQGKGRGDEKTCRDAERAVKLKESHYGAESIEVALSLSNLGTLFSSLNQNEKAERVLARCLRIYERHSRENDPVYLRTLNNHSTTLRGLSRVEEAKDEREKLLCLRRAALGPTDPAVISTIVNLATSYQDLGNYEKARSLHRLAMDLRRQSGSEDRGLDEKILSAMGRLEAETLDYAAADSLDHEILEHHRRYSPDDDTGLAGILNNMAYNERGLLEYTKACEHYRQALAIWETKGAVASDAVALALNNLGDILNNMKRPREAIPLLERALALRERLSGKLSVPYALILLNLAQSNALSGNSAEAVELLDQALAIDRQVLGDEHPEVLGILTLYGDVCESRLNFVKADSLYSWALRIARKQFGERSNVTAKCLRYCAQARARQGKWAEAHAEMLTASLINRDDFEHVAPRVPISLALSRAEARQWDLRLLLSILMAAPGRSSTIDVWDAVIQTRAAVLDEMAARSRPLAGRNDPERTRAAAAYQTACEELSNLWIRAQADTSGRFLAQLQEAEVAKDGAERNLISRSATFGESVKRKRSGYADVAAALPPGSALVGYVCYAASDLRSGAMMRPGLQGILARLRYRVLGPLTNWIHDVAVRLGWRGSVGINERSEPAYAAFLLRSDSSAPAVIPLGRADQIDTLVVRWRRQIEGAARGSGSWDQMEDACNRAGDRLASRIWTPLASHLSGVDRVFVVPDAMLHLVNLDALPLPGRRRGCYLADGAPVIHYLCSERDLLRGPGSGRPGEGLLAVGNPDYDAAPAASPSPSQLDRDPGIPPVDGAPFRGMRSESGAFRTMRWRRLPNTAAEVKGLVDLWGAWTADRGADRSIENLSAVCLTGGEADEGAFKKLAPGRKLIHIASHGFFLGGGSSPDSAGSAGARGGSVTVSTMVVRENPLLQSGLVLAGANRREDTQPGQEDGVLTAEEIATLDLSGVEWAVLSACNTGTGRIRTGEGVLGLRRAFEVAGVRTLIMSLWPVGDASTQEWMGQLYAARLREGMGTAEAMRAANRRILANRRAQGLTTHPSLWAGFVAAGDWR